MMEKMGMALLDNEAVWKLGNRGVVIGEAV